ncbi:hypothetical protein [Proteiniphilum propionicum]|jgi:hypothetical protein|uniref:hypothetical protein n=1 Tax=Proteiniphilum propionicum TaxID=2829812 RepID=UPI001EEAD662|nr:hypothetical protein [Proteiniphilum propionicum]ULB33763.1 hypothetical protein KDN43_12270 [Proteiniphilum propionicum]
MKRFVLIFTLMLACCIPVKLYAFKHDQDSTVISVKKNFDKKIPKSTKKTKTTLSDASGNDLTHNIKKVFLNGKIIQIHNTDSIKAKDIKSITTKQVENGDIWLYIETNEAKLNSANSKTDTTLLRTKQKENME